MNDFTRGLVVCDDQGRIIWVGNPDTTSEPTITVYDSYGKARRALTRIWKATKYHTGERTPYRLAEVEVRVTKLGSPITPKVREDG